MSDKKPSYVIQVLSGPLLSSGCKAEHTWYLLGDELVTEATRAECIDSRRAAVTKMLEFADSILMDIYNEDNAAVNELVVKLAGRETPYDPICVTVNLLELTWSDPRFSVQRYTLLLSTAVTIAYNDMAKLRVFRELYRPDTRRGRWPIHHPGFDDDLDTI
ncbi:hypothetical protein D3C81_376460 [compost metagenome]